MLTRQASVLVLLVIMVGRGFGEASAQAPPSGFETIEITVAGPRPGTIGALLRRPVREKPVPAIVALHGCGGLFTSQGRLASRERDWAERLTAAGYAVLLPDSFNSRGYRQICTLARAYRPIRPGQRAYDAAAAAAWLAQRPFIDKTRIALVGWSNGGSTVLAAIDSSHESDARQFFQIAFAFYPGCRPASERAVYAPRVPLTILIGSSDDWTPPEPCRVLAQRHAIRLIEYPGAVHGFDAPNAPRRTRTGVGLSARGDGIVQVGTDPEARAAAIAEVEASLSTAFGAKPAR